LRANIHHPAVATAFAALLVASSLLGCSTTRHAAFDPLAKYVDKGACPGESCQYSWKWRAYEDIALYARPDSSSRVVDSAYKSTFVAPLTGEVHSYPAPFVVTQAWKDYLPGDTLWMLTSGGEGRWKLRTKNGIVTEDLGIDATGPFPKCGGGRECVGMMLREYRSEWWVYVQNAAGREGWITKSSAVAVHDVAPLPVEADDSAGISLVSNNNSSSMAWDIDSLSIARIDNAGVGVSDVQLLSGGRLLIADSIAGTVRLFDSTGRLVRDVIRAGISPNEPRAVTSLHVTRGGVVYAYDAGSNALLILDDTLAVTRRIADIEFRPDSARRLGGRLELLGVLDDGSIVTRDLRDITGIRGPADQRFVVTTTYRRGIPGERQLASYGELPLFAGQRPTDSNISFSGITATVAGDRLIVGAGDTLAYSVYGPRGELERIVRIHKQKFRNPPGPTRDPAIAALHRILPYERDLLTLIPSSDGMMWLETQFPGGRALVPSWYVLDGRGQVVHHARFRPNFHVKAANGEMIAGVSVNADGSISVVIARIPRHALIAPRE
jgi:hypothetical protein